MKKLILTLTALLPLTAAAHGNTRVDYARVLDVDPVYQRVQVASQNCYVQRDRKANALGGAVIGAVIANQISGHDPGATAVGAFLGGTIGHNVSRHDVCAPTYQHQRQLTGYQVTYRYKGDIYQTFMYEHPGKRIRVEKAARKHFHQHG